MDSPGAGNSSDGCTAVCGRKVQNLVMQFLGFFKIEIAELICYELLFQHCSRSRESYWLSRILVVKLSHGIKCGKWAGALPAALLLPRLEVCNPNGACEQLPKAPGAKGWEADVCPFVLLLTSVALSLWWAQPSDQMCYLTLLLVWGEKKKKPTVWEVVWCTGWDWAKHECLPRGSASGDSACASC